MTPDQELAEQLAEARAFQAEATKGGNRQKSRRSARNRGRGGRDHGDSPSTSPITHSSRGGRSGRSRGGSLLQPAAFEQEQSESHLPATPSHTPQTTKPRPFATPIVAPPSANSGLTPSATPSGIGGSFFAPQAAPKATASKVQARATRGRRFGVSRFASREEQDAVFAFFNDDTPAPVGEVRYYQEEYEKGTSEVPKPNSFSLQENYPQQPKETSSAATSHLQDEPSTVNLEAKNETNPKAKAKAQIKASDEVNVEVSDKVALVDSQNVNVQELEHAALLREREEQERKQQLLREIEEGEATLAEMTKLIAMMKAKAAKLHVNSASGDLIGVLQQVTNTGPSANSPHQGASAAVIITPSTAKHRDAFNSQTSVPRNTGGAVPNTTSNSMGDLMNLDSERVTMRYVPHPTQIEPLGFNGGHSSFQNGFQEAEDEEEL
ncbi:uncharacterized protein B0T23DRAFT_394992 [Neurospora hispaniola]|uniref:Uncharacterized protein n=1 Tax=Neurospora hispaniola TaxID=588809 RepID=A0AAJ0IAC7_9PEZI|nr:hypothetical protein B0T23DRAFT_394992 [Neurospora hispaniola]